MQPTSLAVTPTAPRAVARDAHPAPALTLAADTRSVSWRLREHRKNFWELEPVIRAVCVLVIVAALLTVAESPAVASFPVGPPCDLPTRAASSDVVALGTIVGRQLRPMYPGSPYVLHYVMSVEEPLKGSPSDTMEFVDIPYMAGGPDLQVGQRTVLFLKWRNVIVIDPSTERYLRAYSNADSYPVDADGMVRPVDELIPVEDFLDEIRVWLEGLSPAELYGRAELVVIGEVTETRPGWRRHRLPAEIQNDFVFVLPVEYLKGASVDTVIVVPPPAKWRYTELVAGEQVLLFLKQIVGDLPIYELEGGRSGKFQIGDFSATAALEEIAELRRTD
jgi:hypothetical protein